MKENVQTFREDCFYVIEEYKTVMEGWTYVIEENANCHIGLLKRYR